MSAKSRTFRCLVAAAALCLPAAASAAAVDYFLKLDGIEGESTDDRHKGEIEIASFSVGAKRSGGTGGGAGAGRSCLSDLSFVKAVDKASPRLLGAAMAGAHIKEAVITARKAGEKQQDYLIVTLRDVVVTSMTQAGEGEQPMEAVSISFGSLTMEYKPQKPDGSLGPSVATSVSSRC